MSFDPRMDMIARDHRGRLLDEAAKARLVRAVDDEEKHYARPQRAGIGQAIRRAVGGLFGPSARRRAARPLACAADTAVIDGRVGGII